MQEDETPENGSGDSSGSYTHLWWAEASAGQLGWALMSSRKGCAGNSFTMPFKAFAIASLYVGSIATAGVAGLHASGIREIIFPFLYLNFREATYQRNLARQPGSGSLSAEAYKLSLMSLKSSSVAISFSCFLTLKLVSFDPNCPHLTVNPATRLGSISVLILKFFTPVNFCTCFAIRAKCCDSSCSPPPATRHHWMQNSFLSACSRSQKGWAKRSAMLSLNPQVCKHSAQQQGGEPVPDSARADDRGCRVLCGGPREARSR
ncbi:hypothetical protein TB2_000008 [Malus domestica]